MVFIDVWYAAMDVMKVIEALDKIYSAPIKRNRLVSTSGETPYQGIETIAWTEAQLSHGCLVHIRKFPKSPQVKLETTKMLP